MVNSIATLRGKVKERMRPFTAHAAGFEQRQTNQEVIQENLNRFNLLHPNNFHCKVSLAFYLIVWLNFFALIDILPAQGTPRKPRDRALHCSRVVPRAWLCRRHVSGLFRRYAPDRRCVRFSNRKLFLPISYRI